MNLAELLQRGRSLHQSGRLAEAEQAYRQVLAQTPAEGAVWRDLAWALQGQRKHADAAEAMQRAVETGPQLAAYLCDHGIMLRSAGNVPAAIERFQAAIRLDPSNFHVYFNLGNAYRQAGQLEAARDSYAAAARLAPHDPDVHVSLGVVHNALGELEAARACFMRAVAITPRQLDVYLNLGQIESSLGNLEEAVRWYRAAVEQNPNSAMAHNRLGLGLRACNALEPAAEEFRRAIAIDPRQLSAWRNLGAALEAEGAAEDAVHCYQNGLRQVPDDGLRIKSALTLPVIYASRDEIDRYRDRLDRALDELEGQSLRVDDPISAIGAMAFSLAYHGQNEREHQTRIAALIRRAAPAVCYVAPHCDLQMRPASSRLRVGLVSSNLREHTIGKLNAGLIEQLDRSKFEVTVLRFGAARDNLAQFIDRVADRVVNLPSNLQQAQLRVAEQELDVLLYTDVGFDANAYYLAHARLAPVQCVTWGHPLTTGIPTLDYFISSEDLETPEADAHYTERLARLPRLANYYYRPEFQPSSKSRDDFGLPDRGSCYGCLQSLFKLHPDDDAAFAEILRRDPQGHLVLLEGNFPRWTELLRRRFERSMPDVVARVRFVRHQPPADFARLLSLCDVLLDPLHFGGGDTTYQSFAVGTPVVALPGPYLRSRITYALYRSVGLDDGIARDASDYAERAVHLATDKTTQAATRRRLLESGQAIFENPAAVRGLEEFLLTATANS